MAPIGSKIKLIFFDHLSGARVNDRRHPPAPRTSGHPPRARTVELTIAILQLVASRRGLAALPGWAVHNYIERGYVIAKRVGKAGLWSKLYAATSASSAELPYIKDFLAMVRRVSFATLPEILPLKN